MSTEKFAESSESERIRKVLEEDCADLNIEIPEGISNLELAEHIRLVIDERSDDAIKLAILEIDRLLNKMSVEEVRGLYGWPSCGDEWVSDRDYLIECMFDDFVHGVGDGKH